MKKLLLFPALLFAVAVFGQYTESRYRWGISANIHQANIKNIHWYSKGRLAPSIGFFGILPFKGQEGAADTGRPGGMFFVPQLEFSWDGENNKWDSGKQTYRVNFIEMPLNFRYYFKVNKSAENNDFFIQAGPQLGYAVYDKAEGPSDAATLDNKERINYVPHHEAEFKKFNFGLTAGAGYRFDDNWDISARYDHGLTKAYETNPSVGGNKTYHYKLGLALSYSFNNK